MLRTQISLLGIIFLAVFIETVLIPDVWSGLRIDLFIGMIIGIIIQMSFSEGLAFVIVASIILQAFSGARPGLIPMIYLCTYPYCRSPQGYRIHGERLYPAHPCHGYLYTCRVFAGCLPGPEPDTVRTYSACNRRGAHRSDKSPDGCPCRPPEEGL